MKLCEALYAFRNGGKKLESTVPFKALLPLKLRNSVSGKSDRTSEASCIQEMTILFACLKKNDFNEGLCPKEVGNFQKCYGNYVDMRNLKKEMDAKGILTPGEKKLTHKQYNKLLSMYPNI